MASEAPENVEQPAASQDAPNDVPEARAPAIPESRLPSRKDTSLREFLNKMDDYAPIVCLKFLSIRPTSCFFF